jgi:hypothetical protein
LLYRRFLGESAKRFDVRVIAACEMPNHDHLLHACAPENRTPFLQRLHWQFAMAWNKRHGKHGHVFEERSWSFERWGQEGRGSVPHVSCYIFINPRIAGLCKLIEEYPYSLYRAYLGLDPMPEYVDPTILLNCFSSDPEIARNRLKAQTDAYAMHVEAIRESRERWKRTHRRESPYAHNMLEHIDLLTLTAEVLKGKLPAQFAGFDLEELLSLALNRFDGVRQSAVATVLQIPTLRAERMWNNLREKIGQDEEKASEVHRLIGRALLPA